MTGSIKMATKPEVLIEEMYDAFSITVDGERFYFDQEDDKKKLKDVFKKLGCKVKYEEVC